MLWLRAVIVSVLVVCVLPAGSASAAGEHLFVRWGYVVTYDQRSTESLRNFGERLDVVSPGTYAVTSHGDLIGGHNQEIAELARANGALLIPLVANKSKYSQFHAVLHPGPLRDKVVNDLVALVDRYDYDGIHVDFEGILASDRDNLTAFMGELWHRLSPRGKLVTIAVGAKASDIRTGWHGPYDYAALGRVSHYVVIMTYGYRSSISSIPSSTSPIEWVEDVAAFSVSQIPSEKVLLGLGFWAYDWAVGTGEEAVPWTHTEVMELAKVPGARIEYDESVQSPRLLYEENGRQHEVWFEDARSVAAKTEIARKYNMGGVAGWRLGHEDPKVWDVLDYQGPAEIPLQNGLFFTQTGRETGNGYSVVDEPDGAQFWSEFLRLGGVHTLGYPVSRSFRGFDGFMYQAFQRGMLQWRPELGIAHLANTFDMITDHNKESVLQFAGVPPSIRDDGSNGDWNAARRIRLSWLSRPEIKAHFLSNPNKDQFENWNEDLSIQLYGLPASQPVKAGPFIVQRFQRISLQLWVEDVPGMPGKGSVVGILGGDYLKQAGLVPPEAARLEPNPLVWNILAPEAVPALADAGEGPE